MTTNVTQFISELDGGVLEEKLAAVLSECAGSAIDFDKKTSEVKLTLKMSRIGGSHQVNVEHSLEYKRPTSHGHKNEKDTRATPMHVGSRGAMTLFPPDQTQMFDKRGELTGDQQ